MKIAEHLIVDDEIVDCENSHMDVSTDVELDVADVDSLVANVAEDLYVTLIVDLSLHVDLVRELPYVADMDFMFEDTVVGGCDQLQRLMVKHYVQIVPRSELADSVVEIHSILVFEWMKHRWLIFRFVLLSRMYWKPLVKMKLCADISFGIKVWDILFYLPGESDARASCITK